MEPRGPLIFIALRRDIIVTCLGMLYPLVAIMKGSQLAPKGEDNLIYVASNNSGTKEAISQARVKMRRNTWLLSNRFVC